jgi:NhaA family Na+:H+ antiporter
MTAGTLLVGIFAWTALATRAGLAAMPAGMDAKHLGIVGVLGGIGFTMCLLLTEVAMPAHLQVVPKVAVLLSSLVASVVAAACMAALPKRAARDKVE